MRLMTPAEYADAYEYLREQETIQAREEVAALIEVRVLPLGADVHRFRAIQRWGDTPQQQRARLDELNAAASHPYTKRETAA